MGWRTWIEWFVLLTLGVAGCSSRVPEGEPAEGARDEGPPLRLAVTTSTRDTGLLDTLLPLFEWETGIRVDVIGAGTGKALKLGAAGDVDAVLVHARKAEDAFMEAGHGVRREDVMFNFFDIVGPADDPAGIQGLDAPAALQKIAAGKHRFVSRGDESGTHKRELALWEAGGGRPEWDEYVESGRGMGPTLVMADQKKAYALTDHGTYLAFKAKIQLKPLVTGGESLRNPYGILVVNPKKNDKINYDAAMKLADFLISRKAQEAIRDFKVEGEPLFYPLKLPAAN